jgi:hypothetical protein
METHLFPQNKRLIINGRVLFSFFCHPLSFVIAKETGNWYGKNGKPIQ